MVGGSAGTGGIWCGVGGGGGGCWWWWGVGGGGGVVAVVVVVVLVAVMVVVGLLLLLLVVVVAVAAAAVGVLADAGRGGAVHGAAATLPPRRGARHRVLQARARARSDAAQDHLKDHEKIRTREAIEDRPCHFTVRRAPSDAPCMRPTGSVLQARV